MMVTHFAYLNFLNLMLVAQGIEGQEHLIQYVDDFLPVVAHD